MMEAQSPKWGRICPGCGERVVAPNRSEFVSEQSWSRLSEQIFRVDKWSLCRG